MERREFLSRGLALGICPGILFSSLASSAGAESTTTPELDEATKRALSEKQFIQNWLTDLMNGLARLDAGTQNALMGATGKGCYDRHPWKGEIARKSGGTLAGMVAAMQGVFEAWDDDGVLHIRFGEKVERCYCPAANFRPALPNDPQCECTRTMMETIIEKGLGRKVPVEIVSSVRRGGQTCHFTAAVEA